MSTSYFEYEYIEDVERLEDYRPGGYHPVQINDCLRQRYRIVHKLGYGGFSTAWLALDEHTSKYVAVKVATADADMPEAEILSLLATADKGKASLIPVIHDRFSVSGPNGTHACFVTAPARCSLMDARLASGSRLFQLDVARSLAAQLCLAVSLVHSQGYAHGDLHLGNILLHLPSSLLNLSIDQLYAKFGAPQPEPIVRLDGKLAPSLASGIPSIPSHAIPSMWLGIASDKINLNEARLLLSDFGTAFRAADKSRFESYTPLVIRPPEALFEPAVPLALSSDIWSLACTVFELLAHRSLIDGILTTQDEITAQQIHLQGPLPPEWWNRWDQQRRSRWFDNEKRPLSDECDIWPWERRFEQWIQEPRESSGMGLIAKDEKIALLEMLQWMLAWKPDQRPNVQEVLGTTWMTHWAMPAYHEGRKI